MAAKDDMKARPEHFDEWSASGSDDDENQHLCAPQGNVVSDSSAADGAATPLLECEESRQQHARTPFIRLVDVSSAAAPWFQGHRPLLLLLALVCGVTIMTNCTEGMRAHMLEHRWPAHVTTIGFLISVPLAAAYVYTKGLLAHAYLAIMAVSAGLMVGSVVAAYIANGQGTTVVVAAAMALVVCAVCMLVRVAWQPCLPCKASETAMVWLVNARLWCGFVLWLRWYEPDRCFDVVGLVASASMLYFNLGRTPASIGYKFPALIAVFMHAMTCVSPNLGPLHSAWPLRIILDTCIIVHFRLHLQRFPPVPSGGRMPDTSSRDVDAAVQLA